MLKLYYDSSLCAAPLNLIFTGVIIVMKLKRIISGMTGAVIAASVAGMLPVSAIERLDGMGEMKIDPNPVISRDVPAYSKEGNKTASKGNDENYSSFWEGKSEDYLAYDLSAVPADQRKIVDAVWYTTNTYDNLGEWVTKVNEPTSYVIEVNDAEGGQYPENDWKEAVTVEDNVLSSRQHLIDFEGYNWIRFRLVTADGKEDVNCKINFDIHDASNGLNDSWLFIGDSITAGGMGNSLTASSYATFISGFDNRYFPIQENAGIGGLTSKDGKKNIDRWLETYPGKYVSLAYGTNDAWGGLGENNYYNNTVYMVNAVIEAGKIPVLPTIPYSTNNDVLKNLDKYNAKIQQIYEEYPQVDKGPDFFSIIKEDTSILGGDGVHPNSKGYEKMRRVWAETMFETVYGGKILVLGDINDDGKVDTKDAMLAIAYAKKAQAPKDKAQFMRADVNSDGELATKDAMLIIAAAKKKITFQ